MRKIKMWFLISLTWLLIVGIVAEIYAKSATSKPAFSIRKLDRQVVLYTIFRGNYAQAGKAIGELYALAGKKGIIPRGPVMFAYLNNPTLVSSEHWLTEIRIPVGREALKAAGTLGKMTDVKRLPAMEVAVAVKPAGMTDYGTIYAKLYAWMHKQGYTTADTCWETFMSHGGQGNYSQMKSEILVPVNKVDFKPAN
ncbi:MAG: GyrI-like domain-containing protein [Planctomycetota bacterium]|nr:MAG: GyrI-like domain-containing protein [Planctomycetota bacterium]